MSEEKRSDVLSSEPQQDNPQAYAPQSQRQLTFGEKLVGLTFNPSGDEKVNKAKQLFAELADLAHSNTVGGNHEITQLQAQLYDHTIGEILNAQMNVVKLLTLKY